VQRVPVRIALDPDELTRHPLRIGLSTVATVEVRDDSGVQLAAAPHDQPLLRTSAYDIDRREIMTRIAQIVSDNTRDGGATTAE
jgi:membrane fusion protein (multidrug efflux system)